MKFAILSAALLTAATAALSLTKTTGSYIPQKSPPFSKVPSPTGIATAQNYGPYNISDVLPTTTLSGYPTPWEVSDTKSDEVQAAIKQIDWSLVPDSPVRKQNDNGDFNPDTDGDDGPYCWWSDTNCVKPKVDGYFEDRIEDEQSGNQTNGHIVLEHELNNATVNMTVFWLPKIQKAFNVVPALACNNVTQPYWGQQYVYPLQTLSVGGSNNSASNSSTSATETTIVLSSALPRATQQFIK